MRLPERLSEIFFKEGLISDEEREIVQFGLESLEGNLAGVFLTFAIGVLFGNIKEAIFFYILFFPLRKSVGGFHANTKTRCLLSSTIMLILAFVLFSVFEYSLFFYIIFCGVSGCLIFFMAPVDNFSKVFDDIEYRVYRRRSRMILVSEGLLFVVACNFSCNVVIRSLCMVFFVICVALIMGIVKNALLTRQTHSK